MKNQTIPSGVVQKREKNSIYQYASMDPRRLSGQNCQFLKFLLALFSQERLGYKENNTKNKEV